MILASEFYQPQVNAWGDQPTLEMVRLIVEWGGFCFLDKDKRGDFKVRSQRKSDRANRTCCHNAVTTKTRITRNPDLALSSMRA